MSGNLLAIVDDEESVRKAWARLLRAHGMDCRTYASARDFLISLSQATPYCLLLDLYMSDMTGVELQQELLRLGVDVPIIMITGGAADSPDMGSLGTAAYLRKPITQEELIDAVRAARLSFEVKRALTIVEQTRTEIARCDACIRDRYNHLSAVRKRNEAAGPSLLATSRRWRERSGKLELGSTCLDGCDYPLAGRSSDK